MLQADGYREQGLRKKLVKVLEKKGIRDPDVLNAIAEIPRHQFISDSAFIHLAYDDIAFPIGQGQTISQPYTVAKQSELLGVEQGMKVLEIGTGSGYQTAVLFRLGAKIWSIERQRPLFVRTRGILREMKVRAELSYGDGYKGAPAFAPFDRIIVTCGAPEIPDALVAQLKPGGKIVIPVGEGDVQEMRVIEKGSSNELNVTTHGTFRFVPMLKDRNTGSLV